MAGFTDFFKFVIRCSLAQFRRHETWNSTRIRRQAAEPPMPAHRAERIFVAIF
jgi:hypothetical protein